MSITAIQCRAARGLLDINQAELAKAIGMDRTSIVRFENGDKNTEQNASTLNKIFAYFDSKDIEFLSSGGVTFKPKQEIRKLIGQAGFRALMDEVFEVASNSGGDISILNGSPALFIKHLGQEWYDVHALRMVEHKDNIIMRIVAERGDKRIAKGFADYRWIARRDFHNQSVYIFGNKVAFINFTDDDVYIEVIERKNMATTFNVIFDIVWESLKAS